MGKAAAFDKYRAEVDAHDPDAIVLARYMQVIPPELCHVGGPLDPHSTTGSCPRGARPYHQAYARGVKIIGGDLPLRQR